MTRRLWTGWSSAERRRTAGNPSGLRGRGRLMGPFLHALLWEKALCSNGSLLRGGAGIRDITDSVAHASMHEQRVDHPQVDKDDRYRPPRLERDEHEVDHDRKARNEDAQQTRPGRSGKHAETGREPDDSTDQVDPSPGSG